MQTYKYTAISKDGATVNGVVEAFDEYAAVAKIKENCTLVTKITPVKATRRSGTVVFGQKIKEKELAIICAQFAIILKAGMPIVHAVELIAQQSDSKRMKKLLTSVASDVSDGIGLAHSFETKETELPVTFIETVRAGEESGTLPQAFQRLQAYFDRSAKLKGKIQAAMVYPLFTILVAIAVVAVIMIKAVPTFVSSFEAMGTQLPFATRILIALSNFFVGWWWLLAAIAVIAVFVWRVWGHSETGRLKQNTWKLKLPVLGKINLMRGASQYASTMTTLLTAGISIQQAVAVTGNVMDNAYIGHQLSAQLPKLEEGKPLSECLRSCPTLPPMLVDMTGVGEETGTMEQTLEVVSDYYNSETELRAQKAVNLLEPIIICVLAVIVVLILLAVYLPMFTLYDSMM